jgi:hypothetical protein
MTSRSRAKRLRRGGFLRRAARHAGTASKDAEPWLFRADWKRGLRGPLVGLGHSGGAVPGVSSSLSGDALDHPSSVRRPASVIRINLDLSVTHSHRLAAPRGEAAPDDRQAQRERVLAPLLRQAIRIVAPGEIRRTGGFLTVVSIAGSPLNSRGSVPFRGRHSRSGRGECGASTDSLGKTFLCLSAC